jgi:hypothetical protein
MQSARRANARIRRAHQEWLSISERYTRMHRSRRAAGSFTGRPPWGYRIGPGVNAKGLPIKTLIPTEEVRGTPHLLKAAWIIAGIVASGERSVYCELCTPWGEASDADTTNWTWVAGAAEVCDPPVT